eukprot:3370580-Alexandrium_andersonii.AAC.1
MSASLVGSEMCIRDSPRLQQARARRRKEVRACPARPRRGGHARAHGVDVCLLYTSDAADDM